MSNQVHASTSHQTFGTGVPPLLDLCLYVVCTHFDGSKYLNVLPDFVRQRLGILFKQEPAFQQKIRHLNLSYCYQLTDEELKPVSHLRNLTKLSLAHCDKLTGIGMSYIGQLTNLTSLNLNHCTKISLGLYFIHPLSKLAKLEVAFCEIQDPVMEFICSKKTLTYLNLMCNRLTDEGCVGLSNLTNLTYLSLSMNPLITDKTLNSLSSLTSLNSLNINFCKLLTSEAIKNLSKALDTSLKTLEMIGCDRALNEVKTRPLILLAEDSKIQARMISMVFNRYNFDVEVATNGEMALEMYRENPKYDLILMDVLMPVMDGISCVKQIREYETQHSLKRTPIIIQTADDRESQRTSCMEAGCDEFLPKPLDKACISLAKELIMSR